MDLTGANIKLALEQQWQRDAQGSVPTRPFLRLGVSDGFEYTYDADLPEGSRITSMWLNGEPIDLAATYSVTVNSFLASGGDNFRAFTNGTTKRDTGKIDLQAMVDYMAEFANPGRGRLPPARGRGVASRAVRRRVRAGRHGRVRPLVAGDVRADDLKDTTVAVSLDGRPLGTVTVDNAVGDGASDEHGTTSVSVALPNTVPSGAQELVVTGAVTGTEVTIPITVGSGPAAGSVAGVVSAEGGGPWGVRVCTCTPRRVLRRRRSRRVRRLMGPMWCRGFRRGPMRWLSRILLVGSLRGGLRSRWWLLVR